MEKYVYRKSYYYILGVVFLSSIVLVSHWVTSNNKNDRKTFRDQVQNQLDQLSLSEMDKEKMVAQYRPQKMNRQIASLDGEKIEHKGRKFKIIKLPVSVQSSFQKTDSVNSVQVVSEESGKEVLFKNRLKVKWKEKVGFDNQIRQNNFQIYQEFPQIGVSILEFSSSTQTLQAKEQIEQWPEVDKVEYDIIENPVVPK